MGESGSLLRERRHKNKKEEGMEPPSPPQVPMPLKEEFQVSKGEAVSNDEVFAGPPFVSGRGAREAGFDVFTRATCVDHDSTNSCAFLFSGCAPTI